MTGTGYLLDPGPHDGVQLEGERGRTVEVILDARDAGRLWGKMDTLIDIVER